MKKSSSHLPLKRICCIVAWKVGLSWLIVVHLILCESSMIPTWCWEKLLERGRKVSVCNYVVSILSGRVAKSCTSNKFQISTNRWWKGSVFGEVEVILGNIGISRGAYVLGVLSVLWACLKHFKSSQLQYLRNCEPSIRMAKFHGCSQGIHIQIFGMSRQMHR